MTARQQQQRRPGGRAHGLACARFIVLLALGLLVTATLSSCTSHRIGTPTPTVVKQSPNTSSSVQPSLGTSPGDTTPSSADPHTSTPSNPIATASDPQAALRAQIIAGERAFEAVLAQLMSTSTGDLAPLFAVATGDSLANSEDAIAKMRGRGEIMRGAPRITNLAVASIASPTKAVVAFCEDDSGSEFVDAKTGAVVVPGGQRYKAIDTLMLVDGVWKVATSQSVSAC